MNRALRVQTLPMLDTRFALAASSLGLLLVVLVLIVPLVGAT